MLKAFGTGITPLFPLWGIPTQDLAREMLHNGFVFADLLAPDSSRAQTKVLHSSAIDSDGVSRGYVLD